MRVVWELKALGTWRMVWETSSLMRASGIGEEGLSWYCVPGRGVGCQPGTCLVGGGEGGSVLPVGQWGRDGEGEKADVRRDPTASMNSLESDILAVVENWLCWVVF